MSRPAAVFLWVLAWAAASIAAAAAWAAVRGRESHARAGSLSLAALAAAGLLAWEGARLW